MHLQWRRPSTRRRQRRPDAPTSRRSNGAAAAAAEATAAAAAADPPLHAAAAPPPPQSTWDRPGSEAVAIECRHLRPALREVLDLDIEDSDTWAKSLSAGTSSLDQRPGGRRARSTTTTRFRAAGASGEGWRPWQVSGYPRWPAAVGQRLGSDLAYGRRSGRSSATNCEAAARRGPVRITPPRSPTRAKASPRSTAPKSTKAQRRVARRGRRRRRRRRRSGNDDDVDEDELFTAPEAGPSAGAGRRGGRHRRPPTGRRRARRPAPAVALPPSPVARTAPWLRVGDKVTIHGLGVVRRMGSEDVQWDGRRHRPSRYRVDGRGRGSSFSEWCSAAKSRRRHGRSRGSRCWPRSTSAAWSPEASIREPVAELTRPRLGERELFRDPRRARHSSTGTGTSGRSPAPIPAFPDFSASGTEARTAPRGSSPPSDSGMPPWLGGFGGGRSAAAAKGRAPQLRTGGGAAPPRGAVPRARRRARHDARRQGRNGPAIDGREGVADRPHAAAAARREQRGGGGAVGKGLLGGVQKGRIMIPPVHGRRRTSRRTKVRPIPPPPPAAPDV